MRPMRSEDKDSRPRTGKRLVRPIRLEEGSVRIPPSRASGPRPRDRRGESSFRAFNRRGDFDNLGDTADGLGRLLEESFRDVEVDVVGSAALFTDEEGSQPVRPEPRPRARITS